MTVIAIDGPAAAGKSSVAQAVAGALGFRYVDTGAMYRRIAVRLLERGIDLSDQTRAEAVAAAIAPTLDPECATADPGARLRDPDIATAASVVARYPGVRKALAARQKDLTTGSDVVMEGRDIGTVIAPGAEVKVFLTASTAERARRRQRQLGLAEDADTVRAIEEAILARDRTDANRTESPMRPARDAIEIDSTGRELGEVVEQVLQIVRQRVAR